MAKRWLQVPAVDLSVSGNWTPLGDDRFAIRRHYLLVVERQESDFRYGPPLDGFRVGPNVERTLRWKREVIHSHTDEIVAAIQFGVTSTVSSQLGAKISTELAAKAPGFSGRIGSELIVTDETAVIEAVDRSLSRTSSFRIEEVEGEEHTIVLKSTNADENLELRRRFWPICWDVYLYSVEHLELSYKRNWRWQRVRQTIVAPQRKNYRQPLFTIRFFRPQLHPDVCSGEVDNLLEDAETIEIEPLRSPCPSARLPKEESLEELARLAFPSTPGEKAAAKKRKAAKKKTARKKAKRKAAKRKTAKRKTARKKTAKRKTAKRKSARKKTARKKAARKKATRKVAKRKTAKRKARKKAVKRR